MPDKLEHNILDNLTEPQREAVTHLDGPMLVIAGAGSGKTRVVTRRIAWLLSHGVWPSQILAMTFTNKAAREMRERVEALAGAAPANLGTFHSCCARFLRRDIEKTGCGRTRDFTIYDTDDQQAVLRRCLKTVLGKNIRRELTPSLLSSIISHAKNTRCSLEESAAHFDGMLFFREIEEAVRLYEQQLTQCNAVDFDDLLLLTVRLLEEHPEMQEIYQNRFRYLLVDEYQDTNRLQYQLLMLLTNSSRNVHVTGDPDQCIYSWRGADYSNILSFTTDFENAKVIKLEQNYRSTPTILNAANSLISNNLERIPKSLFTQNQDGYRIVNMFVQDDLSEAEWIARKISNLHDKMQLPWKSFALLYRTNSQSRALEEQFIRRSIPYQLLGGLRFYERKEIKDFLALLRLRVNPNDLISFQRLMENTESGQGIGDKTREELVQKAQQAGLPLGLYLSSEQFANALTKPSLKNRRLLSLHSLFRQIYATETSPVDTAVKELDRAARFTDSLEKQYGDENLEVRKENISSFMNKAADFSRDFPELSLAEFLQDVALVSDVDGHNPAADCVVMMTLHSCKGLEFPCVFIAGVEENLLPHARALEEDSSGNVLNALEEERRLFYVGITRAQRSVFLSHCAVRRQFNQWLIPAPSRFLSELPEEDVINGEYFNHRERKIQS